MQVFDVEPYPKPRMTRRDKWNPSDAVLKYRAFKDECRLKIAPHLSLPAADFRVVFVIPVFKSWSARRRREAIGQPHQGKPDGDNLLKALQDAMLTEDAHIWRVETVKIWGERGQIIIEPTEPLDLSVYHDAVRSTTSTAAA